MTDTLRSIALNMTQLSTVTSNRNWTSATIASMPLDQVCQVIEKAYRAHLKAVRKELKARKKHDDYLFSMAESQIWNEQLVGGGMRPASAPGRYDRRRMVNERYAQLSQQYPYGEPFGE